MENYTWYCLQRKQDHTTTTTTNKDISTKQSRWPSQTPIVECAALLQNQQHMTLYAATHDRMLRPIYHCLLDKYNFQESDHGKPWYQQSLPHAVLENEKAKTYWNVPFILEKPSGNGANKPGVIVHDKETNIWTLFEGTVCQVDKIAERFEEKQTKYIELLVQKCRRISNQYCFWLSLRSPWTTEKWLKINYEHWQRTELPHWTLPEMDQFWARM